MCDKYLKIIAQIEFNSNGNNLYLASGIKRNIDIAMVFETKI